MTSANGWESPARLRAVVALKALGHPVRVAALSEIIERGTASPNEVAVELGAPLGTVAYHVRVLLSNGLIVLHHERRTRGSVEHHYEATSGGKAALEAALTLAGEVA